MTHRLMLPAVALLCSCASPPTECDANPETARQALYRGGWDGNGRSLNGVSLNGVTLKSVDLGASPLRGELSDGRTAELVIADRQPRDGVDLFQLELGGENLCGDGGWGLFVSGTWDERGARHDSGSSFSCTTGAIAKCVLLGYGASTELHQSCTRMVRADYCGTGVSYTRDGTLIDVYDVRGVQRPAGNSTFLFEAAWGPSGAVCVQRPRFESYAASGDLALPSCWAALPRCDSWADAQAQGAELGVSSRQQLRSYCD